jgi:hypothetical protein
MRDQRAKWFRQRKRICPNCQQPYDHEHIPRDLRELARLAGLPKPDLYAGRLVCPHPAASPKEGPS